MSDNNSNWVTLIEDSFNNRVDFRVDSDSELTLMFEKFTPELLREALNNLKEVYFLKPLSVSAPSLNRPYEYFVKVLYADCTDEAMEKQSLLDSYNDAVEYGFE